MNSVFLIEDHDEALKVWRKKKIRNLDLVHLDAHLDFGFQQAKPIEKIINEAKTLKELKRDLERSISFMRYERDLDKQTNIGNYIYPAIQEGIVKNFYWIIPGGIKEFNRSLRFIKNLLKGLIRQNSSHPSYKLKEGIISTNLLARRLIICVLEKLPTIKQRVLLDIDADFLVIDSLVSANNTAKIGKRRPWILPKELTEMLKQKIKQPEVTTISYSVNGGYTPIKYKHLGDEMAFSFAPDEFRRIYKNNARAAYYFNLFSSCGRKEYYRKAVALNPAYRAADNNYGPLYLSLRKFSLAQKEFLRILKADSKNAGCLAGLGRLALEKRDFKAARRYFFSVLKSNDNKLFLDAKKQSLLGIAKAEFHLKQFNQAKKHLLRYRKIMPLEPGSSYILGRIFEKEKIFPKAADFYKDSIRLGFSGIESLMRLLKVSGHLKEKGVIIKFIVAKYRELKKRFLREKKSNLSRRGGVMRLRKIEKELKKFEKSLQREVRNNERKYGFREK